MPRIDDDGVTAPRLRDSIGVVRTAFAISVVLAAGCDGSTAEPLELERQGTLEDGDETHPDDGSLYDSYEFEAGRGYTIRVEMRSTDVDSYLFLYGPDDDAIQDDDGMGEGYDALIVYEAQNAGTWTVLANSSGPGDTGEYALRITTTK